MKRYEDRVGELFEAALHAAKQLDLAFDEAKSLAELHEAFRALDASVESLREILPPPVSSEGNLLRHLGFLKKYLDEEKPDSCRQDARDIVGFDLPQLRRSFSAWLLGPDRYSTELSNGVGSLMAKAEFDSAVRKAFVVLKGFLVCEFAQQESLDGEKLVNQLCRDGGPFSALMEDNERTAWRNLLSGMYGVFRNHIAHNERETGLAEAEAVVNMINACILNLKTLREAKETA